MKTVTLRMLVREPIKVKRITRTGSPVQVTDNGQPLWIIHPADAKLDEAERIRAIDEVLDEVLREQPSKISLAKVLDESRR
jgi:hypothetical protein